jgi:hypothetical protein
VQRAQSWKAAVAIEKADRWTVKELAAEVPKLVPPK